MNFSDHFTYVLLLSLFACLIQNKILFLISFVYDIRVHTHTHIYIHVEKEM